MKLKRLMHKCPFEDCSHVWFSRIPFEEIQACPACHRLVHRDGKRKYQPRKTITANDVKDEV